MPDADLWRPLGAELARWQDAGRVADFWLRDDDAVEPSVALDRLLTLAGQAAVPLALAVVPARAGRALAERIGAENGLGVAVHGWSHENHAPSAEKKQELGPHRPAEIVLAELADAKIITDSLFTAQALPMLVPPWNRIDPALLPALPGLGFTTLSTFGKAMPAPIASLNTHVDLMFWQGERKGKAHAVLVGEVVAALAERREAGSGEPIGILSHHLVHDETAWSFLQGLFEVTADAHACRWMPARELM
jgi:hypothetical protein